MHTHATIFYLVCMRTVFACASYFMQNNIIFESVIYSAHMMAMFVDVILSVHIVATFAGVTYSANIMVMFIGVIFFAYIRAMFAGVTHFVHVRIMFSGISPVYAGLSGQYSTVPRTMPAGTGKRHVAGPPGTLIDEWDKCIKNLTVSSRERQANRLYDRSLAGCWQSSGQQGNVSFRTTMSFYCLD